MSSLTYYKTLVAKRELKCQQCKHFRENKCTLLKFSIEERFYFANSDYCRSNEYLCGPYAKYFDEKNK